MRNIFWLLAIVSLLIGCQTFDPLRSANSVISHNLCDYVFVSGLDPDESFAVHLAPRPGIRWLKPLLSYAVNRDHKTVETTFAGFLPRKAFYRRGQGCTLSNETDQTSDQIAESGDEVKSELPPVQTDDRKLAQALEEAFQESPDYPRQTLAVVVMQRGTILAEKYAPGINPNTPLLGYSLTKSVMSALTGILVAKGDLSLTAPLAYWPDPADPRHEVTLEQLLRMSSGLELDDTGSGFDTASRALYLESDSAAYASRRPLEKKPGTRWEYSSASTLIVSGLIRDAIRRRGEDVRMFAQHELFQPLGMQHVVLETDPAGTPLGSTYMLATARDWARFGNLYASGGKVGGRQLLSSEWIAKTRKTTLGQGYGLGFWLNEGDSPAVLERIKWGMPRGSYFAYGIMGQYVVIIPESEIVIVRIGATHNWSGINGFDSEGVSRLVKFFSH